MRGFWPVYRKELYSLFASPIFYVVAFTFLVIAGYFFYNAIAYFNMLSFQASQNPFTAKQINLLEMVLRPFFMDLSVVMLLLSPLLTMRLYAEEKKTGTLELIFTYPVADSAVVCAKFIAVVSVFAVIVVGTLPGIFLLSVMTNPSWKPILCGYLGLFLVGSAFMSLGTFTSSLTQNQIIAAVLSFGSLLMFWVIGWAKSLMGSSAAAFIDYVSITNHFDNFTKGIFDSRDVLYYVLFIVFFLFLTLRQMTSYRWRG